MIYNFCTSTWVKLVTSVNYYCLRKQLALVRIPQASKQFIVTLRSKSAHSKNFNVLYKSVAAWLLYCSLILRPLPDFISQPWRKIGRRPGIIATSRTGNGGFITYQLSPPFRVREVAKIPGLLLIFLHGCEIKSGSGLGTRLTLLFMRHSCKLQQHTVIMYSYAA